jgi:hypothetical protein
LRRQLAVVARTGSTSLCGMSLRRCWIALSAKHYFKRGKLCAALDVIAQ